MAEEGSGAGLTRTQHRNRNQRARQKALKARIKREAIQEAECEVTAPHELACINRKTSQYRVKCEAAICVNRKDKPACDPPREDILSGLKTRETHVNREDKIFLKPACDFPCEANTELSDKREASKTCVNRKISDTRLNREDKISLEPACDSPCKANTELSNKRETSKTCVNCKTPYPCVNREDIWQICFNRKNCTKREVMTRINHKNKPAYKNFLPRGAKIP